MENKYKKTLAKIAAIFSIIAVFSFGIVDKGYAEDADEQNNTAAQAMVNEFAENEEEIGGDNLNTSDSPVEAASDKYGSDISQEDVNITGEQSGDIFEKIANEKGNNDKQGYSQQGGSATSESEDKASNGAKLKNLVSAIDDAEKSGDHQALGDAQDNLRSFLDKNPSMRGDIATKPEYKERADLRGVAGLAKVSSASEETSKISVNSDGTYSDKTKKFVADETNTSAVPAEPVPVYSADYGTSPNTKEGRVAAEQANFEENVNESNKLSSEIAALTDKKQSAERMVETARQQESQQNGDSERIQKEIATLKEKLEAAKKEVSTAEQDKKNLGVDPLVAAIKKAQAEYNAANIHLELTQKNGNKEEIDQAQAIRDKAFQKTADLSKLNEYTRDNTYKRLRSEAEASIKEDTKKWKEVAIDLKQKIWNALQPNEQAMLKDFFPKDAQKQYSYNVELGMDGTVARQSLINMANGPEKLKALKKDRDDALARKEKEYPTSYSKNNIDAANRKIDEADKKAKQIEAEINAAYERKSEIDKELNNKPNNKKVQEAEVTKIDKEIEAINVRKAKIDKEIEAINVRKAKIDKELRQHQDKVNAQESAKKAASDKKERKRQAAEDGSPVPNSPYGDNHQEESRSEKIPGEAPEFKDQKTKSGIGIDENGDYIRVDSKEKPKRKAVPVKRFESHKGSGSSAGVNKVTTPSVRMSVPSNSTVTEEEQKDNSFDRVNYLNSVLSQ